MSVWPEELGRSAPSHLRGARSGGLYGMAIALGVASVIGGTLLYAHVHLAVNAQEWPPQELEGPATSTLAIAALVAALAAAATMAAYRFVHADERDRAHVFASLLAAALLGAIALGLLVVSMAPLRGEADQHAYAASMVVLGGFVALLLALGVMGALVVAAWVVVGHEGSPPSDSSRNLRALQTYTAVATLALLAVTAFGGGS